MPQEKRKNQRIPADIRTRLTKVSDENGPIEIRITDLSAGGAGFEAGRKLRPGERVQFDIPAGLLIRVTARITSSTRFKNVFRHGTDFIGMEPSHYQVLSSHILRRMNYFCLKPLKSDFICF